MLDLAEWLSSRSADTLARMLARRRGALRDPQPRSISELADRLRHPFSVSAALVDLPRPALQVLEAVNALGRDRTRAELARLVGREPADPELVEVLELLAGWALVWPDGGATPPVPAGATLRSVPVEQLWPAPLQLGPPARSLLTGLTSTQLRGIARALELPADHTIVDTVEELASWFAEPGNVPRLIETAPAAERKLLTETAWNGPRVEVFGLYSGDSRIMRGRGSWARERGLLVADAWATTLTMPREVALAVRGPDYRAPFEPRPPELALISLSVDAVEHAAAAAAARAVSQVAALVDECSRRPATVRKAGGVGAREIRRLAKVLGDSEDVTRLWLELAAAANLIRPGRAGVKPTSGYDEWRVSEPAAQLMPLLRVWPTLGPAPLYRPDDGSPAPAALDGLDCGSAVPLLRRGVLSVACSFPAERAAPSAAAAAELIRWYRPFIADDAGDAVQVSLALWREAELLGLIARGAASSLGRGMLDDDPVALEGLAAELLPAAETTARFQADLTAVVAGPPTAALAALLDGVADREARGTASVWRFTPESVRRAYDRGDDRDNLLKELRAAAVDGTLPQPLEYLVGDVARRHGAVRIRPVTCCLRSDDPALLAELQATRSLAGLGLTLLAPTVLASTAPAADTLAALRAAGYAPVEETADGVPVIERPESHRAPARPTWPHQRAEPEPRDLTALARQLLATGLDPADEPTDDPTRSAIRTAAPRLTPDEVRVLSTAIDEGLPVYIEYTNAQGRSSSRVIEEVIVDGPVIHAWCQLRDDERVFALDRIRAVAPAVPQLRPR